MVDYSTQLKWIAKYDRITWFCGLLIVAVWYQRYIEIPPNLKAALLIPCYPTMAYSAYKLNKLVNQTKWIRTKMAPGRITAIINSIHNGYFPSVEKPTGNYVRNLANNKFQKDNIE